MLNEKSVLSILENPFGFRQLTKSWILDSILLKNFYGILMNSKSRYVCKNYRLIEDIEISNHFYSIMCFSIYHELENFELEELRLKAKNIGHETIRFESQSYTSLLHWPTIQKSTSTKKMIAGFSDPNAGIYVYPLKYDGTKQKFPYVLVTEDKKNFPFFYPISETALIKIQKKIEITY